MSSKNTTNTPNPSTEGQVYLQRKELLVQEVLGTFRQVLPSNYVSLVNGPFYSLQFQAMVEQLVDIQILYTDVYQDSLWDFTRADFLWQVLGTLVFPDNTIPKLNSDTELRDFLKSMVLNLLKGSTLEAIKQGVESLDPNLVVSIVERYLHSPPRDSKGAYTIEDQFVIDLFVELKEYNIDLFTLQDSINIVMSALKPAHVLYSFSYLFQDAFGTVPKEDTFVLDLDSYYYDDVRRNQYGAKNIIGVGDIIGKNLFSDADVSFVNITPGLHLTIQGVKHHVKQVLYLKSGVDTTPRPYTLSTGYMGTLTTVDNKTLYDSTLDWGTLPLDTQITITEGPNSGTYTLERVTGNTGGFIGDTGVSGNYVRVTPSILKLDSTLVETPNLPYVIEVDRLGVLEYNDVVAEDITNQFIE